MTWHTAALCTAFSRTSSLNKVSLGLVLTSVCIFLVVFLGTHVHVVCLVFFPSVQSRCVQWDRECLHCVVPLKDRGGFSVATA